MMKSINNFIPKLFNKNQKTQLIMTKTVVVLIWKQTNISILVSLKNKLSNYLKMKK